MPRPVHNPPNPWRTTDVAYLEDSTPDAQLEVYEDRSRSVLSSNNSPDVGFDFSVNPYRGCYHGCAYCYARPSHELLGLGAGTDFERKISVKPHAPTLLRRAFDRPSWKGDPVAFSGVTDCYQPLEAAYQLTRGCLEVCLDYQNPAVIITKSPLIVRDLDVLTALHAVTHVKIAISIPIWDVERARGIEPFVASPSRRVAVIETLAAAGLDVGINIAPMIPGLSDSDVTHLLTRARDAGATRASMTYLRLPGSVRAVFESRIRSAFPLRAERILNRIRDARGGQLNDARFGHRMRGEGPYAESVQALFETECRRLGLNQQTRARPLEPKSFRRPAQPGDQLVLFG